MPSSSESDPLLPSTKKGGTSTREPPRWVPDPKASEEIHRPRTLVLCFDGTGGQFDKDNSNVVQFVSCLMKGDPKHQLVYYQTGIGTYTDTNFITPILSKISKTLDSMFAWNLASHVQDGYEFLMDNYTAGDRISIFGFSRGAYTARALAGMVERVGLLPAGNARHIPLAWSMYAREDDEAEDESAAFKRTFSADILIDFVGVWDTVASVGLVNKELPFVRNNTAIRVFRHALALDEHRAKFLPNFYHAGKEDTTAQAQAPADPHITPDPNSPTSSAKHDSWPPSLYPRKGREEPTDACEVWFAGCHCDVGGGSVKNGESHSLARIPLRWMIRECYRMKTGIVFDANLLNHDLGLDVATLYPFVQPRRVRIEVKEHPEAVIRSMPSQGYAIVSFLRAIGVLLWFPVRIIYSIVSWPFEYAWLFLKYLCFGENHSSDSYETKEARLSQKERFIAFMHRMFPGREEEEDTSLYPCTDEEDHEFQDALSPEYDQLGIRWHWKLMEYIPLRFVKQCGDRNDYFVRLNLGRGREIDFDALFDPTKATAANAVETSGSSSAAGKPPAGLIAGTYAKEGGLKIHRSVLTRLEALDKNGKAYVPRAQYKLFGKNEKCFKPDPDAKAAWEWVD